MILQEPEIFLNEETHEYHHRTGRQLMGVTKAFELVGVTDFSRVPAKYLDPARERGNDVHDIAKFYGLRVLDESTVRNELLGYYEAIKKFYRERVKRIIEIEEPVFNLAQGYAGCPDIVYEDFDDAVCLDDHKTPIKLHVACKWQTAAYAYAYEKLRKIKIDKRHAVQLRADGTYALDPHANRLDTDFDDFVTILKCAFLKVKNKIK